MAFKEIAKEVYEIQGAVEPNDENKASKSYNAAKRIIKSEYQYIW